MSAARMARPLRCAGSPFRLGAFDCGVDDAFSFSESVELAGGPEVHPEEGPAPKSTGPAF
jgi:hypothetical protein